MTESENYVTKSNPGLEDWLSFNEDLFQALKGEMPESRPQYAPLVDADIHAAHEGVSTEEYFDKVKRRVGFLGEAALRLVHSEMDDAWHITVEIQDGVVGGSFGNV